MVYIGYISQTSFLLCTLWFLYVHCCRISLCEAFSKLSIILLAFLNLKLCRFRLRLIQEKVCGVLG